MMQCNMGFSKSPYLLEQQFMQDWRGRESSIQKLFFDPFLEAGLKGKEPVAMCY